MKKLLVVLVAAGVFVLPSVAEAGSKTIPVRAAKKAIAKHERKTEGDFAIGQCRRANRMVVCEVERYGLVIEGVGDGPQDWLWHDCVDRKRRVYNPFFTADPGDNCFWAISEAFPESGETEVEG